VNSAGGAAFCADSAAVNRDETNQSRRCILRGP
jgi:hypothetical protein